MASNYAEIYITLGLKKEGFDKGLSSTQQALGKFSKEFNKDFIGGMLRGTATTKDFGAQLLTAGNQAGLSTSDISKMAGATGIFTDKQILAGTASANMANRAKQLSDAVKKGEITTREAGKAFGEYAKEQEIAEKSTAEMVKGMLKTAAVVAGVAVAIVAAGKALYEVGKRGAIVTQTAESFEFLSAKLGLAPNLLDQLRKEARGTVDDMTLMSSVATLLAGTTDELGKKLGDATPRLLEIAKAANKLNPQLGDTAFMFSSIALGIKRGQPLILDNLGLTIKVGEANSILADKLGKSVEALTAEEKAMAILEATLKAGDTMIAQVGGTTESATDNFLRMETNVKNLKDSIAAGLSPAIADVTGKLADFISMQVEGSRIMAYVNQLVDEGTISDEQALVAVMNWKSGIWDLNDSMEYLSQYTQDSTAEVALLEEGLWKSGDATEQQEGRFQVLLPMMQGVTTATNDLAESTDNWSLAMAGAQGALEGLSGVLDGQYQAALKAATNSVFELERMKLVLKLQTEDLTTAEIEQSLNMLDSIDRMEKLTKAANDGEVSQRDFRLALADGVITLDEYNDLMGISADNMDDAEGEAYNLRDAITPAGVAMEVAAGQAERLGRGIGALSSKTITVTTKFVVKGSKVGSGGDYEFQATGGPVGAGRSYMVGEEGPELFVPRTGGDIIPNGGSATIGSNMMAGISGGVRGGYKDTAKDTMNAMGGLVASAEKALGIASPSEMFYDIGLAMMTGLAMGIQRGQRGVDDAMADVMDGLEMTAASGMNGVIGEVDRGMAGVIDEVDRGTRKTIDIFYEGGFEANSIWNQHMAGLVGVTASGMDGVVGEVDRGVREIGVSLEESYANMLKYWEDAQSIFGGENPVTGQLPDWPTAPPPAPELPPKALPPFPDSPEGYYPQSPTDYEGGYYPPPNTPPGSQSSITNNLYITTNAAVTSDVPDLLLLRAWASG